MPLERGHIAKCGVFYDIIGRMHRESKIDDAIVVESRVQHHRIIAYPHFGLDDFEAVFNIIFSVADFGIDCGIKDDNLHEISHKSCIFRHGETIGRAVGNNVPFV